MQNRSQSSRSAMSSANGFYPALPPDSPHVNSRAPPAPLSVSLPQQHQFQARLPAMHVPQRASDQEQIYYSPTHPAPPPPPPLTPASATSTSTFMLPRTAAHQYSAAPTSSAPLPPPVYESSHQHQHQQSTDAAAYQQHAPGYYAQAASPTFAHSPVAQGQSHSPVYPHHAAASYSHPHSQYTPSSSHAAPPPHLPPPQSDVADNAVRHTTAAIGSYLTFGTGPFARRTVRAEITEVQKADLGRKCADPPTASSSSNAVSDRDRDRDRDRDNASGGRDKDGDRDEAPVRNVRKDRRPLDPPPVVALRFFESIHHGTDREYEREIPSEEIEIGGLICQVELFRVTIPPSPAEIAGMGLGLGLGLPHALPPNANVGVGPNLGSSSNGPLMQQGSGAYLQQNQGQGALYTHPFPAPPPSAQPQQYPAYQSYNNPPHGYPHAEDSTRRTGRRAGMLALETLAPSHADDADGAQSRPHVTPVSPVNPMGTSHSGHMPPPRHAHAHGRHEETGWESASPISPMSPYAYSSHASTSSQAHPLSAPIDVDALPPPREEDKLEYVLFGEHHSHAASILDMAGKSVIYFVFSDLSVKLEGLFRPRYRFFDLFSRTENCADVPVLAQCFGGAFAVYSTKEFPGLKASTQLTKHLSRWGIRVNIRETERKRRGGPGGGGEDSRVGGGGGRRGTGKKGRVSGTGARRGSEEDEEDADVHRTNSTAVDAPRRYLEGTASGGRARGKGRGRSNHRREGSGGSDGVSAGARGRGRPE